IDENSNWLAEPIYSYMSSFQEDMAVIKKDELFGYLNFKGIEIIKPQYNTAYRFSEGLAVVIKGSYETGLRGYIDTEGNYVIEPKFNWAYSFNNGLAHIAYGDYSSGTFGYINKKGELVSPARN
ncbi:MAG: WG repeat-containing protein, partial [Spirochaetota bacterium]|nr:WG repeat-containing protein [Spirochaetota bacterium]